jgi:hypothetical protein
MIEILTAIIVMAIIIPKLGLDRLSDSELVTYTEEKILKLTGNIPFALVKPTVAELQTALNEYVDALGKASDGRLADTDLKNLKRATLREKLTLQANNCSTIAAGNTTLFLTSGYEIKDTAGQPVGELSATSEIIFRDYGKNAGQLVPDWKPVGNARGYTAQVYTDVTSPDGTVVKEVTVTGSKAEIDGLPRGTSVWVRVRAIGGSKGVGPWSDPANKIVP